MNFGRVGFVMEGDWSAAVTYDTLSVVLYEGAVYAAKRQSSGSEPSTHPADWLMWVGSPVISAEQTENGYDLTITNGDGTTSVVHLLNGQITEAELTTALSGLREAFNANIAEGYSSSSVYSEGDYCLYNNVLYRCKTDILSPEAWDSTHWEAASLADDVQDLSETLYNNKVDAITSNASGEIVTIADGADNLPVKNLSVSLLPVQDLHGQDAPYPPGGKGNIFDEQVEIGGLSTSTGGDINQTDRQRSVNYIPVTAGETYYYYRSTNASHHIFYYDSSKVFQGSADAGSSNGTITIPSGIAYIRLLIRSTDLTANVAINYPSSITTYSPYSNVCPISGWTGVEVYQKGFNVWDEEWEVGGIDSSGNNTVATNRIRSSNYIPVIPDTAYYGAFVGVYTSGTWYSIHFYTANKEYIGAIAPNKNTIFHVPSNAHFMRFNTSDGWGRGVPYTGGICINLSGSRNGEYEPYKGKPTIHIDWTDEAGTVYGGSLDLTTGVLTNDTEKVVIDGTKIDQVATASTGAKYARASLIFSSTTGIVACDSYPVVSDVPSPGAVGIRYMSSRIYIYDDRFTDLATAQTILNANNVEFIIRKSIPTTYQLTPVQIATLIGNNSFWSNGNGSLDLEYRADTKLYIEQLTKPSEDDMTANANIASGKFFMVGNRLMLSTTAIAQGEQIVVGTNCSEVSLADALNSLNS